MGKGQGTVHRGNVARDFTQLHVPTPAPAGAPGIPFRVRRRLYLQIYAAFVAIALVSVAAAGAVAQTFYAHERLPEPVAPVAELIAAQVEPADVAGSLDRVADELHLRLTLRDAALAPIAASGPPHPPPVPSRGDVQWLGWSRGPNAAVHLRDGRWLSLGYEGRWDPRHLLVGLVVLVLATSGLTWPVARRITRRLERLGAVVARWGQGELGVRTRMHGHDEVAQLGRGFDAAADRVQALLDGQRRMLASASHELRSPLARLRLAVELLADDDPARARLVADAVRDVEELDELVGDLLLASRLQARPPRADERVDLGELAAEEAARIGATASGAAVVVGDRRMLRRAVRNLVENARRHGGGSPVEVEVRAAARVEVAVLDRGPGVAEAERERIFEPFHRAAGHAEGRDGGVGLGLALVRDIARHHGGEVHHEPREGGGSRFVLILPTATVP